MSETAVLLELSENTQVEFKESVMEISGRRVVTRVEIRRGTPPHVLQNAARASHVAR